MRTQDPIRQGVQWVQTIHAKCQKQQKEIDLALPIQEPVHNRYWYRSYSRSGYQCLW